MARRYIPPIDPGLATGQAVVGGVNSFMQAFQGAQRDRRQMAMQEAQLASQRELQALQMQKLKEEVGPQEIQLQQIQLALEGMDAGVPGMDSIFKKKSAEIIDSVQTPAQAQLVGNAIRQFQGAKGGERSGGAIGADAMVGRGQPIQGEVSAREPITLNRASRDVLEKLISARTTANLTGARIQAQESLEERRARLKRESEEAEREWNAQQKAEERGFRASESAKDRAARAALLRQRTQGAQTATRVNNINNKITELMSRITGASSSGMVKIPMRGEERRNLESQVESLKSQYKQLTGKDYDIQGASVPALSSMPPPVTPPQKAAPKKADPSPPALPPAAQAVVDSAPEGKTFTLQGKRYKKQGGKLVEI